MLRCYVSTALLKNHLVIYMLSSGTEDRRNQKKKELKGFYINPEGDRFHTDLSKPLPFEGPPGRKTIPTRYFFNKYLEYLMHGNEEKKYDLSLSKIKAARYEQEGIEEMIPHLWSPSIHKYDINVKLCIHHLRDNRPWF
ncbi:hypothetical protein Tco_1562831 [Tanacetum coccineum]